LRVYGVLEDKAEETEYWITGRDCHCLVLDLSWKFFKDWRFGGSVDVAIWGMSLGVTGRRSRMLEAFILFIGGVSVYWMGLAVGADGHWGCCKYNQLLRTK
jgi:hypothetical protein